MLKYLLASLVLFLGLSTCLSAAEPIRVVVWDEQQPKQKRAYENFLGNAIAEYLGKQDGLSVKSVKLRDPKQGLSKETLDACDVLIWWGHARQRDIKPETGKEIVRRIKSGQLSLIALHSAHWATPFVEAMNERARIDALSRLTEKERATAVLKEIKPTNYRAPKRGVPLTPAAIYRPTEKGILVTLELPNCCFPAYRPDGKPGRMTTKATKHPIAAGIPATFNVAGTEMYDEPFHVPSPDAVIFEERWDAGERFRSGMLWKIGKWWVFYFRPGHETYPVYKEKIPLKIIENASRWLGSKPASVSEKSKAPK